MPRSHIVESSEVFLSQELSNDNPIKAPEISHILKRIRKKRRRSSKASDNLATLKQENHAFMDTVHEFLDCRSKMNQACQAILQEHEALANSYLYELEVDDLELDPLLAKFNPHYQQQNLSGQSVQGLYDLYQAAQQVLPIYASRLQELVQDFTTTVNASSNQVNLQMLTLKDAAQAMEKAKEDYGHRLTGPSASWVYDVVRASISFADSQHLQQFVEQITDDSSYKVIQSKNRFQRPAFTGYRDWILHLQFDTGLGFCFVCELQLHFAPIQALSQTLGCYQYYQPLRFYFANSRRDLEARLEDLQAIVTQDAKYQLPMDDFLSNDADLDQLKRLANLFHYHLQEYDIAARLECQMLLTAKVCDVADSYETIGALLLKQGLCLQAKIMHEQALQLRVETMGHRHKSVASSYFQLGLVLEQQEQQYTALTFHNRALAIRMEFKDDTLIVASLNQIGLVWEQLGQYEDAKYNYEKALQIRVEALGDKDPLVACSYSNIGCVLEQQGKYKDALESHGRALAIRQQLFHKHRSISYSLNKMGGLLKELQKYDEAKTKHQQALEIQLELCGETHPSVAASYNNLGAIAMRQGNYQEAESMHRKALQIRLETLGENHTAVANTYSTLGVIVAKQRHYEEARVLHEKALQIRLQELGAKHVSVASSYHCLGVVLEKQGNFKEAEIMHKRALEIRSEILGENHSTVSTSSKRLQGVLEKQVEEEDASESSSTSTGSMIRSTVNKLKSVVRKKSKIPKETNSSMERMQLQACTE